MIVSSFYWVTDSVMSSWMSWALYPRLMFQAPQYFKASNMHAICDGCFSYQYYLLGHFPSFWYVQPGYYYYYYYYYYCY